MPKCLGVILAIKPQISHAKNIPSPPARTAQFILLLPPSLNLPMRTFLPIQVYFNQQGETVKKPCRTDQGWWSLLVIVNIDVTSLCYIILLTMQKFSPPKMVARFSCCQAEKAYIYFWREPNIAPYSLSLIKSPCNHSRYLFAPLFGFYVTPGFPFCYSWR